MRVRWTRPALRDLDEIGDYITRDSVRAADRVTSRIFDKVDALTQHPEIGRPGRISGTRELVVTDTPFIVAYRVIDSDLEVLAVFHGARRWPESLKPPTRQNRLS